jgi:hypothetical protein
VNRFKTGQTGGPGTFEEKWVKGLVDWWNIELKDRTPEWAAGITTLYERDILATAREFGSTRPPSRSSSAASMPIPTASQRHGDPQRSTPWWARCSPRAG